MPRTGKTIVNPVSGERITFRKTSADTDGKYLEIDVELTPDGAVPGMHVHPNQEERFEILSGNVRFRKGIKKIDAKAGDVVVIEPGKAHKFKNKGETGAAMRVRVTPALEMERLLETAVGLAPGWPLTRRACPSRLTSLCSSASSKMRSAALAPRAGSSARRSRRLALIARHRGRAERYVPARAAFA